MRFLQRWVSAHLSRAVERFAWRLAWLLPRKVALFAFIRVYGAWGECGPDYPVVYDAWERGEGR